jgi:flagellin-like hook-associated protein FlgL
MSTISTIAGMAPDQARLRARIDTLTRQISTGQIGQTHGDVAPQAQRAIDLRGDIARREAYIGAVNSALGRMGAAQSVLARIETIASEMAAEGLRARTLGAVGVEALARTARTALEEVAALMNTRHGGEYMFAGSNLALAPVPDAAGIATGPMATAITTAVAMLDPLNATTVLADTATAATAAATTPFNAWLEGAGLTEPRRALQLGDGERLAWGVLANQDHAGQSALSWGRELLRGLATLAALTPASAAQGAGYDTLVQQVTTGLGDATRGLAQERGVLGAAEKRVDTARERHKDLLVMIRAQLGTAEEVDIAATTSALRQAEMRLTASYEATAMVARLSLAALLR